MGLSIHYSGKLKEEINLNDFISDVKDFAKTHHWKYSTFDTAFPEQTDSKDDYREDIYGITLQAEGCENVDLSFLSNRRLANWVTFPSLSKYGDDPNEMALYTISVKTQYAGIDTHVLIVDMLRYLSKSYFEEFKMTDEGYYWETGSRKTLQERFDRYNGLLDSMELGLKSSKQNPDESLVDFIKRVAKNVDDREKKKGKNPDSDD